MLFYMKCIIVFFQKKEASKFGQEPKAQFKLNGIKFYLMEHSEIAIILYWTHWPGMSLFLGWKHKKTYLGASSFYFWQISQRSSLLLIEEY